MENEWVLCPDGSSQAHVTSETGRKLTIRVGPMGSAVMYEGHIAPDEKGEFAPLEEET